MPPRGHHRTRPPHLVDPDGSDEETTPQRRAVRPAWVHETPNTPSYSGAQLGDSGPEGSLEGSPQLHGGVDESTLGSIVQHDVESGPAPAWKGYTRQDSEASRVTRGTNQTDRSAIAAGVTGSARHAAMHRSRAPPVLKLSVSTQATLPTTDGELAIKRAADQMLEEAEEELESVTAQRDSLAKELAWYKAELQNKQILLQQSREQHHLMAQEVQQRRATGGGLLPPAVVATEPPSWWGTAMEQLLAQLRQPSA
jgi:hypothetical protein